MGCKIKERREFLKMSQEELAEKSAVRSRYNLKLGEQFRTQHINEDPEKDRFRAGYDRRRTFFCR